MPPATCETVQEAFRGGAVQYLIKPFTAEAMRERLTEFQRRQRSVEAAGWDREMAQREVDALFGAGGRAGRPRDEELPKGLTVQTLRLVGWALRSARTRTTTRRR